MKKRSLIAASLSLASLCTLLPIEGLAQAFPSKPIRIIVPFTPGSATDTMGRIISKRLSVALGLVKEGKLLALAVSTPKRVAAFPDVPTIAEAGFPKGEFNFWVGLLAPAGTPKEIVARLNDEINKALATPEIKERIAKLGAEPMEMNPAQFDTFLRDEYNLLGDVMRASGAKPQ